MQRSAAQRSLTQNSAWPGHLGKHRTAVLKEQTSIKSEAKLNFIGMASPPGKRDDVPDVLDAGGKQYEPLKAQAEARVRHRAIPPHVQICCIRL